MLRETLYNAVFTSRALWMAAGEENIRINDLEAAVSPPTAIISFASTSKISEWQTYI